MARTKCIICMLLILVPLLTVNAQQKEKSLQWTQQIGGEGCDAVSGIVIDSDNTIYVTGSFTKEVKEKNTKISSSGKYDLFVNALQSSGKSKWLWTAGGEQTDRINALALMPGKKVAIAGAISRGTSLGNKKSNAEGMQIFIAVIGEKGKTDWLQTFTYTKSADLFLLESDIHGNLFACGTFSDSLSIGGKFLLSEGKKDIFILCLSESGAIKGFKSIGSKADEIPSAMAVDTSGNLILGGSFSGNMLIDDQKLNVFQKDISKNIFLLTLSPELKAIASQSFNSRQYLNLKSLKVDRINRLYMAGTFVSPLKMEGKELHSKGQTDVFLAQFSPTGALQWLKQFGSEKMDYAGSLSIDNQNGVILTGAMNDTIESDDILIEFDGAHSNAFAAQFSEDGKTLWGSQLPGEDNSMSYHSAIDSWDNLYISGLFRNTLQSESSDLTSYGQKDVFVVKFENCERDEKVITGDNILCPGGELLLSTSVNYRKIVWNDSLANTKSIVVTKPGNYWVQLIDDKGCTLNDTLKVFSAKLPKPELGNDTIVDVNESLVLNPEGSYVQYLWHDNSIDSVFIGRATDNEPCIEYYDVSVVDSNACMGFDTIRVTYLDLYPWMNFSENTKLIVYPNPVKDYLNWYLDSEESGKIVVDLSGIKGKILYLKTIPDYHPGEVRKIDMQNLKPGNYILGVTGRQLRITVHITHD